MVIILAFLLIAVGAHVSHLSCSIINQFDDHIEEAETLEVTGIAIAFIGVFVLLTDIAWRIAFD